MSGDSLIHLRVPAATKGRWVRASRAAGMRLTDWVVQAVEAHQATVVARVSIPADLPFSALKLSRAPSGEIEFDWAPIERICRESGIDLTVLRDGPEDNVAALLSHWYRLHRASGGERDHTFEDLIGETQHENRLGQPVSLPPGRA